MAKWQNGSISPIKNKSSKGFRLRWRDVEGKQHEKSIIGSKSEARFELNKILRSVDSGEFVGRSGETYLGFVPTFLNAKRGSVAGKTLDDYERGLTDPRVVKILGDKRIQSIKSTDIVEVLDIWTKEDKLQYAKHIYTYLSSLFNIAISMDIAKINPVKSVPKPKPRRSEKKAMTQEQWQQFWNAINEDDFFSQTYFRLMVTTGLRRSEMCGLRVSDVNLRDQSISVQRAYIVSKGRGIYTDTKNHQAQHIPLDPQTFELVKSFIEQLTIMAKRYDTSLSSDMPLFLNPETLRTNKVAPFNPDTWSKWFKQLVKKSGIDQDFTIHELRHTTATILIMELKYDPLIVSKRLRHADVGFTLSQYTHVFSGAQRQASEEIGEFLKT